MVFWKDITQRNSSKILLKRFVIQEYVKYKNVTFQIITAKFKLQSMIMQLLNEEGQMAKILSRN